MIISQITNFLKKNLFLIIIALLVILVGIFIFRNISSNRVIKEDKARIEQLERLLHKQIMINKQLTEDIEFEKNERELAENFLKIINEKVPDPATEIIPGEFVEKKQPTEETTILLNDFIKKYNKIAGK